ncbi:MAG: lipid-binding SYLF domain-containing protein [Gammaproteobacteria bacterium]|nr:lipid-binding SYLF domain-containing protein [Gammaproteobacteria bacterium]MBV9697858.1 lipid-binding SYLF domain-containing protein [Gammaproteobacteria bacterium]
MRTSTRLTSFLAAALCALGSAALHAQAREEGRLLIASEVLEDLRGSRDENIPNWLLERAYAIAVIPDLTKVAFFAGGRHGRGVLVVRNAQGNFSNPVFITMTGGSFGFQWGVQATDIMLVFTTAKGVEGISGGKVTLGADASVAAGPVGRTASAATDANFKAEVYSYSRSRGVFAGIALDGTVIRIDDDANDEFYKKSGVATADILSGAVSTNDEAARRFMAAVATSTGEQRSASAPATSAAAVGGEPAPAPAPAPTPATPAQSFPLADPQPGQEPPK